MKGRRVAVTGMGSVSVAGLSLEELRHSLLNPERRFGPSTRHELGFDVTVAEVNPAGFAEHDHPDFHSPTGALCLTAVRECVAQARALGSGAPHGLVLGTSTGGQSRNEDVVFDLLANRPPESFHYWQEGCMAAPTRLVVRDQQIAGPVRTVSTACTSSANALALAAMWIASGRCERVVAGGGDALCYTTISSFHMLELTGEQMCRPFGADRPGLTLGEGAGFLFLEPLESVRREGRPVLAELKGVGMSSDAHHMTAPPEDGAGAARAMQQAVLDAGLTENDIDHINAHGTGTPLNDAAEAVAIRGLFGNELPVSSSKGLLGHTLGAAGALEAVASILSIQERLAFANLGASEPGVDCPVSLVGPGGARLADAPAVLSNSFAFGGNNCALIFGSGR